MSSLRKDFNYDFHVSFRREDIERGQVFYNYEIGPVSIEDLSGFSVSCKDGIGTVYTTYGAFGRGAEYVVTPYVFLDMTPKGRNESPRGNLSDRVRLHDRYDAPGAGDPAGR